MKKYLIGIAAICSLSFCNRNPRLYNSGLISTEIFTTRLNERNVYGVSIRATSQEDDEVKRFIVYLTVEEHAWMDTLIMEVPAGDTVEADVVFSGSQALMGDKPQLKVDARRIE